MRMQTVASLKEICHAHANHAASCRAACAILTTWQPVSGNLGLQKCSQYSSKQQWQADRLWAPHTCSRAHFLLSTHCSKEMTWQQSTVTEKTLNSKISMLHAAYGCSAAAINPPPPNTACACTSKLWYRAWHSSAAAASKYIIRGTQTLITTGGLGYLHMYQQRQQTRGKR